MTLTLAARMVSSEILKLRKKRSTMLWGLFLGAGSMAIYYTYAAVDHASDQPITGRQVVLLDSPGDFRAWRS
jgi:hypothetical protein